MIGIKAIGTYLPEKRISNFDRIEKFDMTESFIREKIGFTEVALKAPEQKLQICVSNPGKISFSNILFRQTKLIVLSFVLKIRMVMVSLILQQLYTIS